MTVDENHIPPEVVVAFKESSGTFYQRMMSDIVRDLLFRASDQEGVGWTPTTVVPVPAGLLHRAADEIERLNRELDDVWDALAIQREDNVSFGDAFKRQADEIKRLRAALEDVSSTFDDTYSPYSREGRLGRLARAVLAQEKQDD
jgi:hypothetical protein